MPESLDLPRRLIPLTGVKNLRDLGGYHTADGRQTRWGALFRSGHLADMTEECGTEMCVRDIETVIDFRTDHEKVRHPVHWPCMWTPRYHAVPIGGNVAARIKELFDSLTAGSVFPAHELDEGFRAAFETIPIANASGLRRMMDVLIDDHQGNAALIHCTAGKDRTGIGCALVLTALGVDADEVVEDFLLTNSAVDRDAATERMSDYIFAKSGHRVTPRALRPLVGVEADWLMRAWHAMEQSFGSIDGYLQTALGLDDARREKLRERFLTP
ncbi:tyrosine-protein phosphatase [Gimibacter soli]|uniref:Tyrosine-protein phosphatase n=1 Tax=Gimibacter soli TaxID=3024400 RepID=A0AAE9XPQ0_9PROT|nr:tyrosine-protein phosphatase [Gimibacter soli]WCL54019.1 tyrosine-protein phosphatase [Gimibacter soli]